MSQCHKCDKPCGHVLTFLIPSTLPYCVIGPVLEALPTASEEQIQIASAVLRGVYDCGHCAEWEWKCEAPNGVVVGLCKRWGNRAMNAELEPPYKCWAEREGWSDE